MPIIQKEKSSARQKFIEREGTFNDLISSEIRVGLKIRIPPTDPDASKPAQLIPWELQRELTMKMFILDNLVSRRITTFGFIREIDYSIKALFFHESNPLMFHERSFISWRIDPYRSFLFS